jgi:putative transposase
MLPPPTYTPSKRPTTLAAHASACSPTFNVQRHLISRHTLRIFRAQALADWNAVATAA